MSRPLDPRLLRALPPVRRLVASLSVLTVAGGLATIGQATALAQVIAWAVADRRPDHRLVSTLLWLGVAMAARAVVAGLIEWSAARASVHSRAELRRLTLAAVTRLGPAWAQRQPAGRLVTATGSGIEAMDGYLTRAVPALVGSVTVPALVLGWIAYTDWKSAVVLLLTLPLIPLFMALVGVTTKRRMQEQFAALSRLAGRFLDLVQGLTTLKIYGAADRQLDGVRRATESYRRRTLATLRMAFLSGLVLDLIATLSVAVVAVDVGLRLDGGQLGFPAALVVLLLAPELYAPLRAVGAQYHAAEEGRVGAAAALDIITEAPAPARAVVRGGQLSQGRLSLHDLHLQYPERDRAALAGLELSIEPGQIVAITGPSGAGKSSLVALVLGFVAPSRGVLELQTTTGVRRCDQLTIDAWRANLAWVPQRPRPTQATVGAEVGLGDPLAGPAAVAQAIADCAAPPAGTALGEDGSRVSAGQRRRIALARALLRARSVAERGGVPLVLLDEPTEDLDADTEAVVAAVISSLAGWATVLVVSHSAALRAVADRRLKLVEGRVESDRLQRRSQFPARVLPVQPPPERASTESPEAGARSLRALFGPPSRLARQLLPSALLSGAAGIAGLALTASSIWLISRASQHPNVQALEVAVVGVRTFALARALLRYFERLTMHGAALSILSGVRVRVFAALRPLVPAGVSRYGRGDLLRRFVADVDGIQEGLVRAVLPILGAAITSVAAIGLASALVPTAGLVLAAGAVLALLVPLGARRLAGDGRPMARLAGARDQAGNALLDGLAELVAYGADHAAVAEVNRLDRALVRASRRATLTAAGGAALAGGTAALTLPLTLAAGIAASSGGRVSPLAVGVLAACVLATFDGLSPLPAAFAAWARMRAGLSRVAEVLATPAPMPAALEPAPVPAGALGLQLAGADLAPAPGELALLHEVNLALDPGRRVALAGPSGSGKSTLLATTLRLLPLVRGELALVSDAGTAPVSAVAEADLVPKVAGSLQGDHVFDTTLRENLRLVRPQARDHDLDAAAERAGLLEFVRKLPDGWSTVAGPDGANLSGGERQRLLLARALLADPEILILDEPTAHLDEATEQAVLADLLSGTAGRTVLFSTHRRLRPDQIDSVVAITATGTAETVAGSALAG